MEIKKYSLKQVAKWFIERSMKDVGSIPSYYKLQIYLYYTKCFSYVFCNDCFFDGQVEKVGSILVIKEFDDYMVKYNYAVSYKIFQNEPTINDEVTKSVLNFVYETLKKIDDERLLGVYHLETMLYQTTQPFVSDEQIYITSQKIYLNDKIDNNLGITRKDIVAKINEIILKKYDTAFSVLAR